MPKPKDRSSNSWLTALSVYAHRRVVTMVFLGFSAGLPFLLVFSTLSAWLSEAGVERSAIGFFSWVGITFSIKVLWAPVVDNLALPGLTRHLGARRSWMLLAQLGLLIGLLGMAATDPAESLWTMVAWAIWVAFCSATQDICIDAYRIESAEDDLQAAMAATYIFGYRFALLVAGAGALFIADSADWESAYNIMALAMLIGLGTTLLIKEPPHASQTRWGALEQSLLENLSSMPQGSAANKLQRALIMVYAPFYAFFAEYGRHALVLLVFIGMFRISDITMGVMANPFYLELGFSKSEIAGVAKAFGFGMTIFGSAIGGVLVIKMGIMRPLLLTAVLVVMTNLLFALMAQKGPDLTWLAWVISADNLAGGMSNVVFIAFLSSLVNRQYTATQYALFSSLMTLPGKFFGGFSGVLVDAVGYSWFFVYAAATGLPAVFLILFLIKYRIVTQKVS
ncbi:MAG: AmpG family muropeptide MFS transporter [Cellvibrionales bacterium]|nr:MFS transporter [Porticoccaceae bacterium]|tara:strand:+ start:3940 stop:5295 length:1356 start_codon:yes stop_codon:yes gene_type:complete